MTIETSNPTSVHDAWNDIMNALPAENGMTVLANALTIQFLIGYSGYDPSESGPIVTVIQTRSGIVYIRSHDKLADGEMIFL